MKRRTWRRLAWVFAAMAGGLTVLIVVSMFVCIRFPSDAGFFSGVFFAQFEPISMEQFEIDTYNHVFTWRERHEYAFEWPPELDFDGFVPDFMWIQLVWPTLLFGVVALACSWISRRVEPGHCRCGYNLTGNVSGVCPECGTRVAPAQRNCEAE